MFECFNEGFTDEETGGNEQANSLLPKIEVNYPKAHLQPIKIDKTHQAPLSPQVEIHLPDKIHVID